MSAVYRILVPQVGEERARVLSSIVEGIELLFSRDALISSLSAQEILAALVVLAGRARRDIIDRITPETPGATAVAASAFLQELDTLYVVAQTPDPDPPKLNPNALSEIIRRLADAEGRQPS
jgi:hypothetical protein